MRWVLNIPLTDVLKEISWFDYRGCWCLAPSEENLRLAAGGRGCYDVLIPPTVFPPPFGPFVVARSATGQTGSCKKIQSIRVNALKPTNTPLPHVLPTSETFCIALHTFGLGGWAAGRWLPSTRLVYIKETHVVFVLRSAAGMNP